MVKYIQGNFREKNLKDINKREIKVGDTIATNVINYNYTLIVKTVVGFTPKKVKLSPGDHGDEVCTRFPEQCAVVA